MKVSTDNMQRLKSACLFLLEFYKVIMGTMLIIFIPQDCGDHSCSLNENIYSEGVYRNVVKFFNLYTLFSVFIFYIVEIQRENWCIEYLDIDIDKPNNNLDEQIEHYPSIKSNMLLLNQRYTKLTYLSIVSVLANYIMSCIYIIPNHYGSNTYTSLVSFGLLVFMKLYNAYNIATKSIKDEHAYSAFMTTAVTYNAIDDNYVLPDTETKVYTNMSEEDSDDNVIEEKNVKLEL